MSFPLGTHRAIAVDCALGMTSTGKEQIGVMFENVDTKERITWYGYFTEAAIERTVESLRYMGWTGIDLSEFSAGLPPTCQSEVEIVVEDEQDDRDGTTRRKVKWVNGAGGGVAVKDRLTDDQAKIFAAKMKGRIAGLQAGAGVLNQKPASTRPAASRAAQAQGAAVAAAVSRAPATAEQHFADDDIPF